MAPAIFIALSVIVCIKSGKVFMKMTKLTVALAVSGLLGLASRGHARIVPAIVSPDTYVFEAAPGYTNAFNGSTITIAEFTYDQSHTWDAVSAYDFVDTGLNPTTYSGSDIFGSSLVTSYDMSGWVGEFDVDVGSGVTFDAIGGPGTSSMSETTLALDPSASGTWTYVPDASGTFPMLLGVVAALAGVQYCNRPRVLALARR